MDFRKLRGYLRTRQSGVAPHTLISTVIEPHPPLFVDINPHVRTKVQRLADGARRLERPQHRAAIELADALTAIGCIGGLPLDGFGLVFDAVRQVGCDEPRLPYPQLRQRGVDNALALICKRVVRRLCVSNDKEFHDGRL